MSAAKKRIRTHKCITTLPPAFHRHLPVAKEGLGNSLQVVGEVPCFPSSLPDTNHAFKPFVSTRPVFHLQFDNLILVCVQNFCNFISSNFPMGKLFRARYVQKINISFFFFPPLLFSRRRSIDTGLFYWAASRHRLFLCWPVSRCACGREGVSPDLPLPGWEATGKHGGGRVRKEVAERWKVSVLVMVRREIFEEQAGRKGSSCRMGKES